MQLNVGLVGLAAALLLAASAQAQSLSPMRAAGQTPSDIKGFRVEVGNPYHQRMVFDIVPMDPRFRSPADNAVAQPNRVVLAPNATRSVLVAFKIARSEKERTIGLCVVPANLTGSILPRVCGTYTGTLLSGSGG